MDKKILDKMYDAFPDSEIFEEKEEFDTFLVGDGSAHLIKNSQSNSFDSASQLSGVNSIGDLFKESKEQSLEVVNDLADFDQDEIEVKMELGDYFYKVKKDFLDKFQFIQQKSKLFKGRPIRERDLVINNDDSYLLHYVEEKGNRSKQVLSALAQLSACKDMGFSEVQFYQIDDCPLCKAFQRTIHDVSKLISTIGSGQDFIHKGCFCEFVPVIRSRNQFKEIQNGLTLSAYIGKVYFNKLPLEFVDLMTDELVAQLDYEEVWFVDFAELKLKNWKGFKIGDEDVVLDLGQTLWVRDNYILNYSPYDFLLSWIDSSKRKIPDKSEIDLDNQEIMYLNGKRVVERDGSYIEVDTGEVISLFEGGE